MYTYYVGSIFPISIYIDNEFLVNVIFIEYTNICYIDSIRMLYIGQHKLLKNYKLITLFI